MAERLVSPGVFTRENDLSFLPQGIAEIGAAFVGPTQKGPAFRPIVVQSQDEFRSLFGGTSSELYTPYAVRNYLREANRATVVRILGLGGYDSAAATSALLFVSGADGQFLLGVLHPSRNGVDISSIAISGSQNNSSNFALTVSGANGTVSFAGLSATPTDQNYFAKALGSSPTTRNDVYAYTTFPRAVTYAGSGSVIIPQLVTGELNLSGSVYGTYRNARTPMVRSQLYGGTRYNLFQFYMLSDGNSSNRDVKVSIASVRPSTTPTTNPYGTFSVVVRRFADTDARQEVIEQFDGLNLDPSSPNHIARRIGTARTVLDVNGDAYLEGDYPNNSKFIYVEMADGADDNPEDALPYGHAALATPVFNATVPKPAYVVTRYSSPTSGSTAVANNRVHYGFDFSDETSISYLNPTPSGSVDSSLNTVTAGVDDSLVVDTGFFLDATLGGDDATDVAVATAFNVRKFTLPFQGGFDGMNPAGQRYVGSAITADNTQGFDLSDADADGAIGYARAIRILSNPDAWDVNMLVLPGVIHTLHPYITQTAIEMCEDRGDAFFILDPAPLGASTTAAVNAVQGLDTNYAAVYHPWVKVLDTDSNKNIWVPPSVVMCGVFAFSDKVSAEWFAPAGLNRGGITQALQVRARLAQPDRDFLYEGRVNPIAQFPAQGIVAWGQKTLQQRASALDRINVRRLLIAVKKFIASSSRYLVFEQNVESTRQRFLNIANPYLASVQERNGLYAFRVIMDETNNTPDIIDRNLLVGQIYLQPSKTAEFISLEFNVTATGALFEE